MDTAKTKYVTKPGKHGTLYLYRYDYFDPIEPGFPRSSSNVWAYSAEHAEEKFLDGEACYGEGFEMVAGSLKRVVAK